MDVASIMREAVRREREALERLEASVGSAAEEAVRLLHGCAGRVVVTGMGKAGLVGRKVAATLSSVGVAASFLHPADALHGDLGMVRGEDVVLALSNSGETDELLALAPHLLGIGVPVIALTGNPDSSLARRSHVCLDVSVAREADPLGIAPTASTTAMIAMGDALAAALEALNELNEARYATFHPGGSIGRRLLYRVRDVMHGDDRLPRVLPDTSLKDAICELARKRLGAVFVTAPDGTLAGIFTDGDLGRVLQREADPLARPIREFMTREPRTVRAEALAAEALRLMEAHAITLLPVLDDAGRPVAAVHMHDLVQAGLALWPTARD